MAAWMMVVPIIDPPTAAGFLDTVHPSVADRVIVVDNCARPFRAAPPGVVVHRSVHNLGVARSWNLGVRQASAAGASHVVLASSSVRLGPSGGRDLDGLCNQVEWGMTPEPTGWHTAIFNLACFDRVGLFDENLWPAYWEDVDMTRRLVLAGVHLSGGGPIDAVPGPDGHGVDRLRRDHPGLPTINYEALQAYWDAKWGVHVEDAYEAAKGHATPFGVPGAPLSWWQPVTVAQLMARYGVVGR